MLCRACRRQLGRHASFCAHCGQPVGGGEAVPVDLVLRDGTRVPVAGTVSIGRAPDNSIQLSDPSVSRYHARVLADGDWPEIEDTGSSHGTFVDGHRVLSRERLGDGARIQLGDALIKLERRRDEADAGRTIVVRPGASLVVPAAGTPELAAPGADYGFRPCVRSGWALKRLEASEGEQRYVLKDLRGGEFVRMSDDDAALFELLDGRSALPELIAEAERRYGPAGSARLARLLADLGERGLLESVERPAIAGFAPGGRLARLFRPKERTLENAGEVFEELYENGGFLLFTRVALALLAFVAVAGLGAFAYLVIGRYGTPFVVARKIGLGGFVFLLGRFLVVALHELAHGLTVASFGRRVPRAGLKLMFVFPYAFVDTSDGWFESRWRRIAISAAGPGSDLLVGGAFSLLAAVLSPGTVRDIVFQLAFAAYIGAFFNLNPFLDRDGYMMLVDFLREPGLRRRSKERLRRKLAGQPIEEPASRATVVYSVAALGWSVLAAGFAILLSMRYYSRFTALAPREVVWVLFGTFYVMLFVPVLVAVGRPLVERRRTPTTPVIDGSA